MLFTNKQTNKQMERQTNANDYITSPEGGGYKLWVEKG